MGTRVGGQLIGTGLEKKVLDILTQLAKVYAPGDTVMLFGFSRGAFTVRAVAGMLHRFGLPSGDSTQLQERLRRCWKLYRLLDPDPRQTAEIMAIRAKHRAIRVHFLGLFDTVKAYGGLWPVRLPHLRHNPIVDKVRHALAIHEHRAWFAETTWGRLDIDEKEGGPISKLEGDDLRWVLEQDIKEIWFCGYHSDIGSGKTALRWILAEAVAVTPTLHLSAAGRALLDDEDPLPATFRDSMRPWWWVADRIPRAEIFNDRPYARRAFKWPSRGAREPTEKRRNGLICVHDSAEKCASLPPPVETVPTT